MLSCFCNNDYVCNNNEDSCTCPNDCSGTCSSNSNSPRSSNPGGSSGGSLPSKLRPSKKDLENGYEVRIGEGQTIQIIFGVMNNSEDLEIKNISKGKLVFSIGGENYEIFNSSFKKIDLDGDGFYDVEIWRRDSSSEKFSDLEFILTSEKVPSEEEDAESEKVFDKFFDFGEGVDESDGFFQRFSAFVSGFWENWKNLSLVLLCILFFYFIFKFIRRKKVVNFRTYP